jgi:hypothetical protein
LAKLSVSALPARERLLQVAKAADHGLPQTRLSSNETRRPRRRWKGELFGPRARGASLPFRADARAAPRAAVRDTDCRPALLAGSVIASRSSSARRQESFSGSPRLVSTQAPRLQPPNAWQRNCCDARPPKLDSHRPDSALWWNDQGTEDRQSSISTAGRSSYHVERSTWRLSCR